MCLVLRVSSKIELEAGTRRQSDGCRVVGQLLADGGRREGIFAVRDIDSCGGGRNRLGTFAGTILGSAGYGVVTGFKCLVNVPSDRSASTCNSAGDGAISSIGICPCIDNVGGKLFVLIGDAQNSFPPCGHRRNGGRNSKTGRNDGNIELSANVRRSLFTFDDELGGISVGFVNGNGVIIAERGGINTPISTAVTIDGQCTTGFAGGLSAIADVRFYSVLKKRVSILIDRDSTGEYLRCGLFLRISALAHKFILGRYRSGDVGVASSDRSDRRALGCIFDRCNSSGSGCGSGKFDAGSLCYRKFGGISERIFSDLQTGEVDLQCRGAAKLYGEFCMIQTCAGHRLRCPCRHDDEAQDQCQSQ